MHLLQQKEHDQLIFGTQRMHNAVTGNLPKTTIDKNAHDYPQCKIQPNKYDKFSNQQCHKLMLSYNLITRTGESNNTTNSGQQ